MNLAFASVRQLGEELRARRVSSVELARLFLERLEKLGPQLNAVVTVTHALALEQAAQADRELAAGKDRGPLHGIPYGAKDLLGQRGFPTSWGAPPLSKQTFDEDATVVKRLRDAGAVLVGKLALVEIAGGMGYQQANAALTGPGLNPWDRSRWAGGSSSGSGAAVAAGLVPFAIGSETWGSIVTPAAYCGVTGLRPTYGRVSRHGAMALSWTLDKLGPMARSADDCGLVLQAIAGHDPLDASSAERPYRYPDEKPLSPPFKLAMLKGCAEGLQDAVRANFLQSLEVLKPHASIEEIELPDLPYSAVSGTIIDCESAAAFEHLIVDGRVWKLQAPEDRIGIHAEQFIAAKDYINALRIRAIIQRAMDTLLAPFDALLVPARPTVAPPIDRPFAEYQRPWTHSPIGGAENAAGVPAITIPNGLGEAGLPTALHLVARAWDENRLLAIASWLQQRTNAHTLVPPAYRM